MGNPFTMQELEKLMPYLIILAIYFLMITILYKL